MIHDANEKRDMNKEKIHHKFENYTEKKILNKGATKKVRDIDLSIEEKTIGLEENDEKGERKHGKFQKYLGIFSEEYKNINTDIDLSTEEKL